ncbi:MAG: MGMT family protein [Clostridia bacterium]|nr:MGMT family protein [Clostridia bacterium]NCC42516.1 MGMT family protein [Clostridia bacterium]
MDFYKRMQFVCGHIPCGCVTTYGQIALLCQKPKNSRQVGYALNRGLAGEDVPAHRVVNARGILSGASAFEMPDLQKMLLEEEGVETEWTPDGYKVDLKKYGWKNTIEEAMLYASEFERLGI